MLRITYICFILLLLASYSIVPSLMDKAIMMWLLVLVLISLLLFFGKRERNTALRGQNFKHSNLALVGIIIVFFQYPLDFVLDNVSSSNLYIWANQRTVLKSLTLSVIGLQCFFLGYLLIQGNPITKVVKIERPTGITVLNILAAFALLVYFLTINPLYLAGYYGIVDMGSNATYAITFFQVLIFASIIQKSRNVLLLNKIPSSFKQYIKQLGWPLVTLVGFYLLSVLISGDRGPLIFYGIMIFSGYFFVTKKKLSLKYALLLLFIGTFVISILGIARNINRDLSFTERVRQGMSESDITRESSFSPQTEELARSVKSLNIAVDYVPAKHGFLYGRFQFQQFVAAVPFFSSLYPIIFHDNSVKYNSSASLITWILQGNFPTHGNGTSCMADFYFDFGLIGVIVGMFLFGYLMRLSELAMYSDKFPGLIMQVFFMVYLCYALYIGRGTLFSGMKIVVWVYVMLLINRHFLQKVLR